MTCTMTVDGPCRRTLSFSIDRTRMDAEVEKGLTELSRRKRFKGFRPGKVPLDLIRKTHGKELAEEARRTLMSEAFEEAIREHGLRPVGEPELNLQKLEDEGGGPFTFEMTIEVAPEFELAEIETIPVTVQLPPIDEAMIDGEVERLRRQAGHLEEAPDEAEIDDESVLGATIVYTVEGEELEPRAERSVLPRHEIVDGFAVPGSGERFKAARKGAVIELEAELPPQFDPPELAGRHAGLKVTIDSHRRAVIPPLGGELLERMGVSSVDELRQRIREALERQRNEVRNQQIDRAVEDWLLEKHVFELPERLTAKAIDRRVHELAHQLIDQQKLDPEAGHAQAEEHRERVTEGTRRSLATSFVFSRIASEQQLGATLKEAEEQVRSLAMAEGADPEALMAAARSEGWLSDVLANLTEQKTREWLRARCEVTEAAPPPPTDD
jgi:trigger factor